MTNYLLFTCLGLLPSLIWLLFYLRRDVHPEPNEMVLKIFIYGMGITLIVAFIEIALCSYLETFNISLFWKMAIQFLIAIALIEELAKYLVVKVGVLKNPAFDEPIDAMIYMIVAGLGFAAVENILILFPTTPPDVLGQAFITTAGRFLSATLLHALAAANIGYFIALSFLERRKKDKIKLILFGIILSVILHGLYDIGIKVEGVIYQILIAGLVLIFLTILVIYEFHSIKKLKSICKL